MDQLGTREEWKLSHEIDRGDENSPSHRTSWALRSQRVLTNLCTAEASIEQSEGWAGLVDVPNLLRVFDDSLLSLIVDQANPIGHFVL